MTSPDFVIHSLPYLDSKWLRADLYGALQSNEDLAVLWNNLIRDNELVQIGVGGTVGTAGTISQITGNSTVNCAGNLSFMGANGKHYCGVQKLLCSCCTGYCRPASDCNCYACHQLDNEETPKKNTNSSGNSQTNLVPSDLILDSWLWGPIPSKLSFLKHTHTHF